MSSKKSPFKAGIISLVGKTNVGKSTLLNQIIGEKIAIISKKVQTTRNVIRGIKTIPEAQMVFVDTPGFFSRKQRTEMDKRLILQAKEGFLGVDLILFLISPFEFEQEINEFIISDIKKAKTPAFLLINKIDLIKKEEILPIINKFAELNIFDEIFPISALVGINLDSLQRKIIDFLPENDFLYDPDIISTAHLRFMVAEIIREKVYELTHQELPYASAVKIEKFKEGPKLTHIKADIYVEKASQKGMMIGKKGAMIKRLGIQSRKDIEELLQTKTFLEFNVKVKKKWRSDEHFLLQLGL